MDSRGYRVLYWTCLDDELQILVERLRRLKRILNLMKRKTKEVDKKNRKY